MMYLVLAGACHIGAVKHTALTYERIEVIDKDTTDATPFNELTTYPLPVEIPAKGNFKDYKLKFIVPKDTLISIHAVGEAADYNSNPALFKSWDNDGVEIYFDMKNDKVSFFDVSGDDRQYRVLWKTLSIDGRNINKDRVIVYEKDPSSTTYFMLMTFPWKSLGYFTPRLKARLGFDISLIDSDGGTMKAELNWHSKSEDAWKNVSYYGTMILLDDHIPAPDPNFVYAKKRIGGSSIFQNAPTYKFNNVTIGYVTDSLDLSGHFQAEWDDKNLYLKVFCRDNIKSVAKAIFDFGSIEDQDGRTIWNMNFEKMKPAGGALKNQEEDDLLALKKGVYWLKYHTDESHSPGHWDDAAPRDSFYGIRIAYPSAKILR